MFIEPNFTSVNNLTNNRLASGLYTVNTLNIHIIDTFITFSKYTYGYNMYCNNYKLKIIIF